MQWLYSTSPRDGIAFGMRLVGVEQSTIANGTTIASLVCEGTIEVLGVEVLTAVALQDGPILLGTQLLAKLGKDLQLDFVSGAYEFKNRKAQGVQKAA